MGSFLKGNQHQFVFSRIDSGLLVTSIFEQNNVLFENYVHDQVDKKPIANMETLERVLQKRRYTEFCDVPELFIVPQDHGAGILWECTQSKTAGSTFLIDPLNSHAVQLLLSRYNSERISVGRISVCKEWQDDGGIVISDTDIENTVYTNIRKAIRAFSVGKIGGIMVGRNAFELCRSGAMELAYDLTNPNSYKLNEIEILKGSAERKARSIPRK
jgi:hypothetical protein